MRVMVCVMADEKSEAGVMPTEAALEQMMKYNEEMVKAGVVTVVDGAGLLPTSQAKRVRFSGTERTVIDGPFAESKELIAGYGIWEVKSMADALEWAQRAPFEGGAEVTIRPIFGPEDFGAELTPELREQEERLRAESARLQKS